MQRLKRFLLSGWSVFLFAFLLALLLRITLPSLFDSLSGMSFFEGVVFSTYTFAVCFVFSATIHKIGYRRYCSHLEGDKKEIKDSYIAQLDMRKALQPYCVVVSTFFLCVLPWLAYPNIRPTDWWVSSAWFLSVLMFGHTLYWAYSAFSKRLNRNVSPPL